MKTEVILIDDDKIINYVNQKLISTISDDVEIREHMNGKEAIDYLLGADSEKRFLILLDINMPVMDGWEFLANLEDHGICGRCHVVVLTSSIDSDDKERADSHRRVASFVSKPLRRDQAVSILREFERISATSP